MALKASSSGCVHFEEPHDAHTNAMARVARYAMEVDAWRAAADRTRDVRDSDDEQQASSPHEHPKRLAAAPGHRFLERAQAGAAASVGRRILGSQRGGDGGQLAASPFESDAGLQARDRLLRAEARTAIVFTA